MLVMLDLGGNTPVIARKQLGVWAIVADISREHGDVHSRCWHEIDDPDFISFLEEPTQVEFSTVRKLPACQAELEEMIEATNHLPVHHVRPML